MSIVTYQIKTTRVERSNENFPLCECGSAFIIEDHYRKRKPKEVYATVARCSNQDCEYAHTGYIDYDYEDLPAEILDALMNALPNIWLNVMHTPPPVMITMMPPSYYGYKKVILNRPIDN